MRRVLCVWFPRLATECLARPHGGDGRRPVAAVVHGGALVAAVSEAAETAGVRAGMAWGDARARCPALRAAPRDREREAGAMRVAARLAERYGPWVVPGADDLLIDVAGTAHLFGGERAMLEDCRRVFAERGRAVRAAVAGGADAARGLARFAGADLVIGARDAVRALPVEALGLGDESAARLRRVGLRRIGDLESRPRTALAERFGERLIRRLDRMLEAGGRGSEPLGAGPPRPALRVGWEGMEPLLEPASVEAVCAALLEKLGVRLRRGDLGARSMVLVLGFDAPGAGPRRVEVRAGRGLRDPRRWLDLFRERPEAFDPGSGVVRLELAAGAAEPFDPAAGSDREGLWERLSARLGSRNVVRFRRAARHRPEAASAAEPVLARTSPRPPAADADPLLVAGRYSVPGRFDRANAPEEAARSAPRPPAPLAVRACRLPARPSAPFGPCDPPPSLKGSGLDALADAEVRATKIGERSGSARVPPPSHVDSPLRSRLSTSPGSRSTGGRRGLPSHSVSRPPAAEAGEGRGWDGDEEAREGSDGTAWAPGTGAGGGSPRPLRLLVRPEPIEVEAALDDPLDPPVALRTRGGRAVRLSSARGPERIAPEWWREREGEESGDEGSPAGRDYWRVETEDGVRLWLYRELRPGPARWFLHGLFP